MGERNSCSPHPTHDNRNRKRNVMSIRNSLKTLSLVTALALATPAFAATVMVGGAAMFPNKTIVDNAVNSADHTTLVAAVKAAGLVDTLEGPGPFTVFAPV